MKKSQLRNIIRESIKQLMNEYQVKSHYGWRKKIMEKDGSFNRGYGWYSDEGEYVSAKNEFSLKNYTNDEKPWDPEQARYSEEGDWPEGALSFGEGDNGSSRGQDWAENANKNAEKMYAKIEDTLQNDPDGDLKRNQFNKDFGVDFDKDGNIIKYEFSVRTLYHDRTM